MGRTCDLTGKSARVGNKISHSNIKTKRKFCLNLHKLSLFSSILNKKLRMKISINTLRIIERKGGIDEFLLSAQNHKLTPKALCFKKLLLKCQK